MRMFLNGTAMSGQPDHHRLQRARFLGAVTTAPRYRFYAVRDEFPGLVPVTESGRSIQGELYDIGTETWQNSLGPSEPRELDLGQIELADGISVYAMILDPSTVRPGEITDITELGSWRRHLEATGLDAPRARTS